MWLTPLDIGGEILLSSNISTVIISENTSRDYTGVIDVETWSAVPTANYGGSSTLLALNGNRTSFIKFPGLSNIPSNATITSATLSLYHQNTLTSTLELYRLLRNWNTSTCSWTNYDTALPWTTAGGTSSGTDRSATLSATTVVPTSVGYFSITGSQLTADIQNFISGAQSNYGWVITDTLGVASLLAGSSDATDGQRPILEVSWTIPGLSWTPSTGSALYDMIDELSYSDADYITSPALGTGVPVSMTISSTLPAGTYQLNVRARRTGNNGQVRLALLDGSNDSLGTSEWQALTNNYTTYALTVTTTGDTSRVRIESQA
jgi:hypothetical protein